MPLGIKLARYVFHILIWIDQGFNVIFWGYPDETLSARAYRANRNGRFFGKVFHPLINFLFFWQIDHCKLSYLAEMRRKQFPTNIMPWETTNKQD